MKISLDDRRPAEKAMDRWEDEVRENCLAAARHKINRRSKTGEARKWDEETWYEDEEYE